MIIHIYLVIYGPVFKRNWLYETGVDIYPGQLCYAPVFQRHADKQQLLSATSKELSSSNG